MTQEQCGCKYIYSEGIQYCPLHAAAPALLEACNRVNVCYINSEGEYILSKQDANAINVAINLATKEETTS